MGSRNQIFTLLLALSFLWYMCHRPTDNKEESEHFVVHNVMQVPPIVADDVYQFNQDLNYEQRRQQVKPMPLTSNIATHRLAPLINPKLGQVAEEVYTGVTVPSSVYSTRVPDGLSNSTRYNIPSPHYNDALGGFQNTNAPTPTVATTVAEPKFLYQ